MTWAYDPSGPRAIAASFSTKNLQREHTLPPTTCFCNRFTALAVEEGQAPESLPSHLRRYRTNPNPPAISNNSARLRPPRAGESDPAYQGAELHSETRGELHTPSSSLLDPWNGATQRTQGLVSPRRSAAIGNSAKAKQKSTNAADGSMYLKVTGLKISGLASSCSQPKCSRSSQRLVSSCSAASWFVRSFRDLATYIAQKPRSNTSKGRRGRVSW
mmetsp:Transcript_77455/g.206835  ORF Transcript_77455/g.206835 Transcript_77455/m.206835 type:complete len:216 (-) Transcript_77455:677-1324(-)